MLKVGCVKWFDSRKGYGFIVDSSEGDVLVHYSTIAMEGFKELEDGEVVFFTETLAPGNKRATTFVKRWEDVRVLGIDVDLVRACRLKARVLGGERGPNENTAIYEVYE